MRLASGAQLHKPLLPALAAVLGRPITALSADSRSVTRDGTFLAYPGERADGRNYITQAIERGAGSVLWEAQQFRWQDAWRVPNLGVVDLRQWVSALASEFHAHPSERLWVVGVTGTNGKTSCSQWLAQCLAHAGRKTYVVGTLGNGFVGALRPSANTTPDALQLQRELAGAVNDGAQALSMEVSSHGLEQGRVNGVKFDVALFTNLSRDHLDYHGDMQHYFAAKARLFGMAGLRHAVVNLDDAYGRQLAQQLSGTGVQIVGYTARGEAAEFADGLSVVKAESIVTDRAGVGFRVRSALGEGEVRAAVLGHYNIENLLGVWCALRVSGCSSSAASQLVSAVQSVPGRLQRVGGDGAPLAVIDYAHTPDALQQVLRTLAAIRPSGAKLITVFGCGGDRDKGKRPLMGQAASSASDLTIVTSDNPRSEQPEQIIADILPGVAGAHRVEADRAEAIALAFAQANAQDIVLLAGKGHEDYQEIAGRRLPFSDAQQAHQALARWRSQQRGQRS